MNETKYPFNYLNDVDNISKINLKTKFCIGLTYALFFIHVEDYYKYHVIITEKESKILTKFAEDYIFNNKIDYNNIFNIIEKYNELEINKILSNIFDTVFNEIEIKSLNKKIIKCLDKFVKYEQDYYNDYTINYYTEDRYYDFITKINDLYCTNKDRFIDILEENNRKKLEYSELYIGKADNGHYRFLISYINFCILALIIYDENYNNENISKKIDFLIHEYVLYYDHFINFGLNDEKYQHKWDDLMDYYSNIIKHIPLPFHKELKEKAQNEYMTHIKNDEQNDEYFIDRFNEYISL